MLLVLIAFPKFDQLSKFLKNTTFSKTLVRLLLKILQMPSPISLLLTTKGCKTVEATRGKQTKTELRDSELDSKFYIYLLRKNVGL